MAFHVYKNLKNNFSFILLGLGSFFFFLVSFLLKLYFTASEYGMYSLVITVFSTIYTLGLFGIEHTLLRFSVFKNGILYFPKNSKLVLVSIILAIVLCGALVLSNSYFESFNLLIICLFVLGILLCIVTFNVLRLVKSFFLAQLINNGYKILCFVLVLLYIVFIKTKISLLVFFTIFSLLVFIFGLIGVLFCAFTVRFAYSSDISWKLYLKYSLGFFLSILIIAVISYGDRFYIEYKFGIDSVGEYFYLANLFLFPLGLVQQYAGFKELVVFKEHFTINLLKSKIITYLIISFLIVGLTFISVLVGQHFGIVKTSLSVSSNIVIIIVITGIFRVLYSLVSSVIGAHGSISIINFANLFGIVGLLFLWFILSFVGTMNQVLIIFLFFWIYRYITFVYLVKRIK